MLTQEVSLWAPGTKSRDRLHFALQRMFPASAEKKVDEVKSLTETYHKYKSGYLKHLCFNPDNEYLSKCF